MPIQLQLEPSQAFYSFSTTLDGLDYLLNVRWNTRDAAWYFDLLTAEGESIRSGIKIVLGTFPGRRSASDLFPDGVFIVEDTARTSTDATFDDLGVRVLMYFYTSAEWSALA